LGMDARNLTDENCEQLVQTLERAIDAHHAASYRRKAVVA